MNLSSQTRENSWIEYSKSIRQEVDWKSSAACRGNSALNDLLYPTSAADEEKALAVAPCRGCPVRSQCLEYALVVEERHGIWGGVGAEERWKLQKLMRKAGVFSIGQLLGSSWGARALEISPSLRELTLYAWNKRE